MLSKKIFPKVKTLTKLPLPSPLLLKFSQLIFFFLQTKVQQGLPSPLFIKQSVLTFTIFFSYTRSSAEVRPPSPQFSQSLNFWKFIFFESTPNSIIIIIILWILSLIYHQDYCQEGPQNEPLKNILERFSAIFLDLFLTIILRI